MVSGKCNGCPDWTTVDRSLLSIKATYFFLYGAFGFLHPYIVVFMKQQLGLSPIETSIVLTVVTIGSAVARIVIGVIADAFRKHSVAMTICCVITAVGHVILYFTPPTNHHGPITSDSTTATIVCNDGQFFVCLQQNSSLDEWENNLTTKRIAFKTENLNQELNNNSCSLRCCNEIQQTQSKLTTSNEMPSALLSSVEPFTRPSRSLQSTETCKTFDHRLTPHLPLETNQTLPSGRWQTNCSSARRFDLDHHVTSSSESPDCPEAELFAEFFGNCTFSCTEGEWEAGGEGGSSPLATQFGFTFWMFIIVFFVIIFASNPAFSVIDSITYSVLRGREGDFGRVRLWGTIALGTLATSSGLIMDALGGPQSGATDAYLVAFVTCSSLLLLAAVTAYHCPSANYPPRSRRTEAPDHRGQQQETLTVGRSLVLLLRSPSVDVIFVTVLVSGVLVGCHDAFFFWFLNSLDAGQMVLGMCVLAMSLSEVLLLFTSGRIVALLGYRVCLYVTFVVYGCRFLVNSFLVSPWLALLTESAQSICCGLMFPAASMSINEMAPDGMHGTIQGILGALHWSVGRAIGLAVAGLMYEAFGPRLMYRIISGTAFLYALFLAVTMETMRLAEHCRRQKKKEPDGVGLEIKVNLNGEFENNGKVKEQKTTTEDDEEAATPMLP